MVRYSVTLAHSRSSTSPTDPPTILHRLRGEIARMEKEASAPNNINISGITPNDSLVGEGL